tara:strand:- start:1367 stop:1738 length:372 start_codon:yes stop_codon:yes gene_type:complete
VLRPKQLSPQFVFNSEADKQLVIQHQAESNTAKYSVFETSSGKALGAGVFSNVFIGRDSFLNTVIFTYENTEGIVGLAIDSKSCDSLESIPEGKHSAKSDAFLDLGSSVFEGSTLSCTIDVSR